MVRRRAENRFRPSMDRVNVRNVRRERSQPHLPVLPCSQMNFAKVIALSGYRNGGDSFAASLCEASRTMIDFKKMGRWPSPKPLLDVRGQGNLFVPSLPQYLLEERKRYSALGFRIRFIRIGSSSRDFGLLQVLFINFLAHPVFFPTY